MKAVELVKGKYYIEIDSIGYHVFCFKEIKESKVYAIGDYCIRVINAKSYIKDLNLNRNKHFTSNLEGIYEEVEYSDFMSYFPNNHPYKINYLRKQKIKILLNDRK